MTECEAGFACNCKNPNAADVDRAELRQMIQSAVLLRAGHAAPDAEEFNLLVEDSGTMPSEMLALLLAEAVTIIAEAQQL